MSRPPRHKPQSLDIKKTIQQAVNFHQQGKLKDAERLYQATLKVQPNHFDALHLLGVLCGQQGDHEAAIKYISLALQQNPRSADAHANIGNAQASLGRHEDAIKSFDTALAIDPRHAEALTNRGNALATLNRFEEATASFNRALAIKPNHSDALNNRGIALAQLSRNEEAVASFDRALAIKPDHTEALKNRGIALAQLSRYEDAIVSYDKGLELQPNAANVLYFRGNALGALDRYEEAIASYDRALTISPDHANALNNRGAALAKLNRHNEAIASYDKALVIKPDHADALKNRGHALAQLGRHEEAIALYNKVLANKSDSAEVLYRRGTVLAALNRHEEAIASFEKTLAIKPDFTYAFGHAADCRAHSCDWKNRDLVEQRIENDVRAGKRITIPFVFLSISESPADQLTCATTYVQDRCPGRPLSPGRRPRYQHDRIRVAYLSADFHDHATACLMAGLFEQHDRAKLEILGISFGHDSQGEMRARLMSGFERFIDVRARSDEEVARLLRASEVDIAVDLKGFTGGARTGILARRAAPIQVNYLGYPWTMGADYIDYILADRVVIPEEHHQHYTEKVVYLPDCYQVNDSRRKISERTPSRAEIGLPQQGFVFCCFNNNYKITPRIFDIWMRLLKRVEDSVLWLLEDNPIAARNLRQETQTRGVDSRRLVFAPKVKLADHLARHRLADLFLDTLPYNAHTSASDALWAGLPVLTCAGTAFAGRVAGSLLQAVGLPELVTSTLEDYEALALKLATHETLLRDLRERLAQNRLTKPLFDTDRFRRHIEAAYTTMWEIHQNGEDPRTFAVMPAKPDATARSHTLPNPPDREWQTLNITQTIQQALGLYQQGNLEDAERLCKAVLQLRADHFDALHLLGVLRARQGRYEEAVRLISLALAQGPRSADAHSNLGIALVGMNREREGLASFDKALAINPNHADALNNRGIALAKLNRHAEALVSYDKCLALRPDSANVLYRRGNALVALNRFEDAVASFDKALAIETEHPGVLNNRGIALARLNRHEDAIASFDQALAINQNDIEALRQRGNALVALGRIDEAITTYDKALTLGFDLPDFLNNYGVALARLKRYDDAIASFDKALSLQPDYADAHYNRAYALLELRRYEESIASLNEALRVKPDHLDALINRGNTLHRLKRYIEAIASYDNALSINPEYKYAAGWAAHSRAHICDWTNHDSTVKCLVDGVRAGKPVITPFAFLAMSDSAGDQLTCATIFCSQSRAIVQSSYQASQSPPGKPVRHQHDRIRLAYLSADFDNHATAHLIAGLFERHDPSKFEITAISFGRDSQSSMRSRLVKSVEHFVDVRTKTDEEVAAFLKEAGVDIAVDLKGFTTDSRPGILARRPAPIQVNYLGYPGTMGADFLDYIVADEFVIPPSSHAHYSEKIVYLPECYQVNDSKRKISHLTPTRAEVGLPHAGFVFCCFNNSYKITPQIFDVWMRLLNNVEDSVLWLYLNHSATVGNLRREAAARRIDPSRLVFAPRVKLEYHLSRHRVADLFLDTLPCNAHTTASDALWAELPVLTCVGGTFAGRVAGSLLHAVGLPELVTSTLEDYEALALKLAADRTLLTQIKEKLARNRLTKPLFNTDRFRRHVEAAYTTMWEIHQSGEAPQSFAVPPAD